MNWHDPRHVCQVNLVVPATHPQTQTYSGAGLLMGSLLIMVLSVDIYSLVNNPKKFLRSWICIHDFFLAAAETS